MNLKKRVLNYFKIFKDLLVSYKLHKLELENFVVFVDRTSITFDTQQINYIEAAYTNNSQQSNGAGKSLLICAISLAMFGKGIRSQYISDYVSETNPDNGIYIGLELEHSVTKDILKIERWRRPKSDVNKAKVWLGGKCISDDMTISKIDELIQLHVGVSHANFMSCIFSVMLPGFLKQKPAQRFEILENALAVRKMESVIKKINVNLKQANDKYMATTEALIDKSAAYGKESAKYELYSANKDSLRNIIVEQQHIITNCLLLEAEYNAKKSGVSDLLQEAIAKSNDLSASIMSLESKQLSLSDSRDKLQSNIKLVEKGLKKKSETTKVQCIICKSELTQDSKASIQEHYSSEILEIDNQIAILQADIDIIRTKKTTVDATVSKLQLAVQSYEQKLRSIYVSLVSAEQLQKQSEDTLRTAEQTFTDTIVKLLETEVKELTTQQYTLKKEISILNNWKIALSKNGLRLSYIREEVDTLSALTSKYASTIYNSPIHIKFFINEDKESPSLEFTVNGKNASLFSTGESRRLEIAITLSLMALLKTAGMNLNFLLLDEAFDGLSAASKSRMITVLDELSLTQQLLVISHDTALKDRPGHIISITKDPMISQSTIQEFQR